MCHNATESTLRVTVLIYLALLIHIHDPIVPPFVVIEPPVVGTVGDKRVFSPSIIAIRTTGQEAKQHPVRVLGECVGEPPVRILTAFFAATLRWVRIRK